MSCIKYKTELPISLATHLSPITHTYIIHTEVSLKSDLLATQLSTLATQIILLQNMHRPINLYM